MRITFDKVANAMYIYLNEGQVARTEEKGDYLVDYDNVGIPVGIEILFVSEKVEFLRSEKVISS